jgi:GTPase
MLESSFIGVLTHDVRDNGRGKSRLNTMKHRHELLSGKTSSLSLRIIGFGASGNVLLYLNIDDKFRFHERVVVGTDCRAVL